jgi:uncharacterized membrane protein YjgN (DUF898 family)
VFNDNPTNAISFIVKIYAAAFIFIILGFLFAMPYHVAVYKSVAGAIELDNAEFSFDFSVLSFLWLWVSNILLTLFSLGILTPVVQARSAKYMINHLKSHGTIDVSKVEQTELGPEQAEGLSDALDIGII